MIGKSDFVPLSCSVNYILVIEIEQEAAHVLVIDLSSPVGLVLGDDLPAIFRYELVLAGKVLDKDTPSSNIRGRHEKLLAEPSLDHDVPAGDLGHVPLVRAAAGTQVGIALPDGQEAGTLLGGALGLASAAGKPVLTVSGAQTELLAEIRHLDARTIVVTRLARVVAGVVVVHRLGPVIFLQLNLFTVN